jgi:hypothetical protein
MKNLKYLALVALATPALADPNATQQYEAMRQAYYQFDTHSLKSFTCHVDVSALDTMVTNLKQVLAAHADSTQIKDDLASYSLTIDAGTGLSINNPTLDITLLNEKGMADPDRVKLGIQQSKQGFDAQVQGADQIISGIFNNYLDVVPDLESVTHQGDKWIVRYNLGGYETTDTIEGSHKHGESSNGPVSFVADSDYMALSGGKLALQKKVMQGTEGEQSLNTTTSVTYQKLGALYVPASITSDNSLATSGVVETTTSNTITFTGCSLKN